jgi:hypothetical protein
MVVMQEQQVHIHLGGVLTVLTGRVVMVFYVHKYLFVASKVASMTLQRG